MTNKTLLQRFEALKAMNLLIKNMNNEDAYYQEWILIVPDEADDIDLMGIAEDEELFADATRTFLDCMLMYGPDGLFIGGAMGEYKNYTPHESVIESLKEEK